MIHCSQKLGIHAAIIFMTLLSASVVAENMHDNRTYLVTGNRVVFGHGIDAKQLAQEEQVQLPANRYKLLHDGEDVLDTKTNLIWRRCAEGMRLQQHHCIGKPNGNGQSLEGFVSSLPVRETLWRMPTTDELMSLVLRQNVYDMMPVVDAVAFPDTPRARFVAAQEGRNESIMYFVDFSTGKTGGSRPLFHYPARLVRDGNKNPAKW